VRTAYLSSFKNCDNDDDGGLRTTTMGLETTCLELHDHHDHHFDCENKNGPK
jgi:hypothetical protein